VSRSTDWIHAWERAGRRREIDFLFLDHDTALYRSDLDLLLKYDLLNRGCVVVADRARAPDAADFVKLVTGDARFRTAVHETTAAYAAAREAADDFVVAVYQGRRSDAYAA
jgi:predicted O-methyltransferase YrrM